MPEASDQPISPLEGEMAGRPEGGAVAGHLSILLMSGRRSLHGFDNRAEIPFMQADHNEAGLALFA